MKTFIVFIAILAAASAKSVNRFSGWGSSGGLLIPSIEIELGAGVAAAASGQGSANQSLIEVGAGSIESPTFLQSISDVVSLVGQDEDISQIATADKPSGATLTINNVDVVNVAVAEDNLKGNLGGGLGASVVNDGQSESSGEGSLAAQAESLNVFQSKKN